MEQSATYVIGRADVNTWLTHIIREREVIAPTRGAGGDPIFAPVSSPDDVLWTFENPLGSPKQFLLPQTEALAHFRKRDGHYAVEPAAPPPPRVLFNVRSCDASALAYLRETYARDLSDDALARSADALTVVTLACTTPCELGFCVCCDAGPFLQRDFDLQLTDLGASLFVEVGSDKGRALIALAPTLFRAPSSAAAFERARAEVEVLGHFGKETCHFASAMRRISTHRVPDALWEAMSPWCVECGGCTHICPTCYCFSVADEVEADDCSTRCRLWDSCQYAAFTMEASGHNPRAAHAERIKRRFHHKVSAQYFQRDGRVGCVGCGRCVKVCMGALDMPAVVAAIRHGHWEGEVAHA
ncbi:MAG: 4Fe-4S dicluster domain-containing protein [Gemmatimonadaceae bacterium]|nr:4Fe-4S dicluster domain-containing protein [Gemmatimonadaceae bacterium]